MAQATTSSLTANMSTFFDNKLLTLATPYLRHEQLCTLKTVQKGAGKTVSYARYTLPSNSAALTEGTIPTAVAPASSAVTATLGEEGAIFQVSDLLALTNIDTVLKEYVNVIGAHSGNTLDARARDEMFSGATVRYVAGRANNAAVTAPDVVTSSEIRKVYRNLMTNYAPVKQNTGRYAAVISEYAAYDVMSDTTWVSAKQYSAVQDLYESYIGTWLGFDFVTSNQGKSESSTVTVWSNFFMGEEAVGKLDLSGLSTPKMYVGTPDDHDTFQGIPMYMNIGWKAYVTYKTLNANFIINLKGASAG